MMDYHAPARTARGTLCSLVFVCALLAASAAPLSAQRWQEVIGGNKAPGEEGNAVIESATGDIVAAGVSNSAKGTPLAYVVRTDPHGTVLWQDTYDVNTNANSVATDIKEYPNGDLAVVGTTNAGGVPNAFAMRLDATGTVLWCTILTAGSTISEANGVVIAQQGDGSKTFADDIVLCGRLSNTGGASYEALLVRLDANGNGVWAQSYDLQPSTGAKFAQLYGLDETQIATVAGKPGEIVAVGSCDDAAAGFPADALYLRVDGNSGLINAPPHGAALLGGTSDDIAYSVTELRNGAHPGDVVFTGMSDSRPAPSSAGEVFLVQAYDDPCDPNGVRAATFSGDNGSYRDWALCVREIRTPVFGTVGDVMVSGGTTGGNYWPSDDAFLQQFKEGSMIQAWPRTEYGGVGTETARSLAQVPFAPTTPGFVFTGSSTTPWPFTPGNTLDLFLVKTDLSGTVPCSTSTKTMSDAISGWAPNCITPVITGIPTTNIVGVLAVQATMFWPTYVICYTPFKSAPGSPTERSNADEITLSAGPNPVRAGTPIHVEYRAGGAGITAPTLTVTDLLGRTVYENETRSDRGRTTVLIPTTGWCAGTYIINVRTAGQTVTTRVVVGDR